MENHGQSSSGFRGMPVSRHDAARRLASVSLGPREARIKRTDDWLQNGLSYINDYAGKPENLTGLSADWPSRAISFPDGLSDRVRAEVSALSCFPNRCPRPVSSGGVPANAGSAPFSIYTRTRPPV